MHDQLVENRRDRAQPRAEIGDQLGKRDPGAEQDRVFRHPGRKAERPEEPEPQSSADADDQRQQQLTLHVADKRLLDLDDERR